MNKKKPVEATTAVATDSFEESKEISIVASKDKEGHYIGDDGDRLFTRDEVTRIIKARQDRFSNGILSRYGLSSFEELDVLVALADKVNDSVEEYRNSRVYAQRIKSFEQKELHEFVMLLNDIGRWEIISISKIQRFFGYGFPRASRVLNKLLEFGLVYKDGTNFIVNKEEIAKFIARFEKEN